VGSLRICYLPMRAPASALFWSTGKVRGGRAMRSAVAYRCSLSLRAGDWSAHCGNYDPETPPTPAVQDRMVAWLTARQAGVTAARAAFCATELALSAAGVVDCADGAAVHAAAGVEVLHGSEVNLVMSSMRPTDPLPNNVLRVLPRVALDVVSYSS